MIQLQFSRSTETVSYLIARACRSRFSHVDVVMPDGNLLGASDSPHAPFIEGNPSGVAIRPPNYQPFAIRRLAQLLAPEPVEKRFYEVLRSQLGEPFDNKAMHAIFDEDFTTDRDWRDASSWFCSELKAWSLEQAGFFPWPLVVSKVRITPPDLLLMANFAIINIETFMLPILGLVRGSHEQ